MKVSKFLRNSIGMSLVEVMAAVAITGGLSLVVSQLLTNQSQGVKQNEAKSENMNLKGLVQDTLNNTTACAFTMQNITAPQWASLAASTAFSQPLPLGIKDKLNGTKFSTTVGNIAPLTITAISLTNYVSALQTGDLIIQATFKRSATVTQIVKPIRIPINFNFTPSFPTSPSCSTMAIGGEWMLGGNAGTSPGTDYMGTSDAQAVVFKTNATERMRMTTAGNLGIDITVPTSKLHISSSVSSTRTVQIRPASESYSTSNGAADLYTPAGTFLAVNNANNTANSALLIDFGPRDAAGFVQGAYFGAVSGPSVSGGPANLVFGRRTAVSTWAESMRIDSMGNLRIGTDNVTNATYSFAQGLENFVSGRYGHGVGYLNTVSGEAGSAIGKGNIASGINSHAVGEANLASGLSSSAHGYYNLASGAYSLAAGYYSTASGSSSTALGSTSTASGSSSFAGASGIASGSNSIAFGSGSEAGYSGSIAFLGDSKAQYAFAAGLNTSANGMYSVALGRTAITGVVGTPNSAANGFYSIALSAGSATASGNNAVAIGQGAIASNSQAYAIGYTATASGGRSIAIGGQVKASGTGSNMAVGGNLHQSHQGTMLGANPWGTTLSRGDFITTIFGPTVDICTAGTIANTGTPEWGAQCDPTASVNISRTGVAPYYARVGIGYFATAYSLAVNCTGNPLCAYKSDATGTWLNASDRRLKNIGKDYEKGLKEILKIKPVYFRYKDNKKLGLTSEKLNIGIVAQDVQPHFPEAVGKDANGFLTFHLDPIIWGSVNAIKEHDSEIEKLKKENKDLKAALCELHPEIKICKNK